MRLAALLRGAPFDIQGGMEVFEKQNKTKQNKTKQKQKLHPLLRLRTKFT